MRIGSARVDLLGKPHHERCTKMTISDSTLAIIGTGNIGGRLAADFAAGGQDFLLAGRDQDAAGQLAAGLGGHAGAGGTEEAAAPAGLLGRSPRLADVRPFLPVDRGAARAGGV